MTSQFQAPLSAALRHTLSYLEALASGPVAPGATLDTLRASLTKPLAEEGMAPEDVIADLVRDAEGGIMGSAGGRFFAWVIGGSVPAALAADWLASAWDQNAVTYQSGPAAAIVEEVAAGWLKEILGLPAPVSFAFVTGCQMAHVTCLAAARHSLLANRGWDVERRGLYGAPPIRILTSTERHGTSERALRYLGMGLDHVVDLPVDDAGRLLPSAVENALSAAPSVPTIIILQAADLNIGAYDLSLVCELSGPIHT